MQSKNCLTIRWSRLNQMQSPEVKANISRSILPLCQSDRFL